MVKRQGGLSSSTGVEKELHFSYPVLKQISPVLKTLVLNNLDQYQNWEQEVDKACSAQ